MSSATPEILSPSMASPASAEALASAVIPLCSEPASLSETRFASPPSPAEAACALVAQSHSQAVETAARQQAEALTRLLEAERTAHAIQRANATQARRVAECLRAFHDALLKHLAQPCFALDREGIIVGWNPAMERWSGRTRAGAQGRPFAELVGESARERFATAEKTLRDRIAEDRLQDSLYGLPLTGPFALLPDQEVANVTLLPLCRIPGWIEAVLVLIEP